MILILSQSENETTTEDVIDWLWRWDIPCYRLNGDDLDASGHLALELDQTGVNMPIPGLDCEQVQRVWFRRWRLARPFLQGPILHKEQWQRGSRDPGRVLEQQLVGETDVLSGYIRSKLSGTDPLGKSPQARLNKLAVLEAARECGLTIPATLVTDNKAVLANFRTKYAAGVITKPLSDATFYDFTEGAWGTYTAEVDDALIEELPDPFFPSLFQEKLPKRYELRVFFLRGRLWSMAIFSQANLLTQVDFRRYDHEHPNRTVPYALPNDIAEAIISLMQRIKLDTGSIDLIRDTSGRYIFLEINPAGQFGMVSKPCNYFLEREVAAVLASETTSDR